MKQECFIPASFETETRVFHIPSSFRTLSYNGVEYGRDTNCIELIAKFIVTEPTECHCIVNCTISICF